MAQGFTYGTIPAVELEGRRSTSRTARGLKLASALAVVSVALLMVIASRISTPSRLVLIESPARLSVLCEGHFLDTATGIPEGTYSSLHHPDQLEGYKEPLPEDIRAAIDQKYYAGLGPEYQFAGCLDDNKVHEVKVAVQESKNEHGRLSHYAFGHDEPNGIPKVAK